MPSQASTPRTTRNSRGLRSSTGLFSADSCLGDSARVSRRRRSSGTPSRANLALSLPTAADPATPTPRARFAVPSPSPVQTLALEAIPEEQQQLATPPPTAIPAAVRPSIYPPPVTLPPATPHAFASLPRTSSPPEHPRITAIRSTPTGSARRNASPRTPVRCTRYLTRFVDVTPSTSPAPAPRSPGSETQLFRQRRGQEGEEEFARELWIAIRNDHYMRGCWCGPPNIYNSREEAEVAGGHLRFYVAGSERKNLRVLQKKDDFGWHCSCGNNDYQAVYAALINSNGKRPAEDTEIDLISQNQNSESGQSIDRVVPTPAVPTLAEEARLQAPDTTQAEAPAPAQSMWWAQACGLVSRAVATMGSPLVTLFGTLREQFRGDAFETLDTRRKDADNDIIIVKRLKRQAPVSPTEQSPSEDEDDGFDDLLWAEDPTKRIGSEVILNLQNTFANQREIIDAGCVIGGSSIADIQMQIQDGYDLETSIVIHRYREYKYGPTLPEAPYVEQATKFRDAAGNYRQGLENILDFLEKIYDHNKFEDLKRKYSALPRRLPLNDIVFRQISKMVAEFLGFFCSLNNEHEINTATLEAISQMIVDANAVHKQEMLPSYVQLKHNPMESMPGYFPEDKVSALEEIPAEEIEIHHLYDYRYPEQGPSNWEEQIRPGDYRLVAKPKGILKPSKEWLVPASPRYVSTPEKTRKLAFINPVSKFIPPRNIPSKVMTPQEADQIVKAKLKAEVLRDEHSIRMFEAARTVPRQQDRSLNFEDKWNLEALERDDQEMGLTYHAKKYDGFLSDLQDDLEKRAEEDKENRTKPTIRLTPRQRIVRIPLPPLPSTPEMRRRTAHLFKDDTDSPATSTPEINPLMRPKVEEQPTKPAEKKKRAHRTLEEFLADDEDDLEISVAKLQQLQIDRQIRDEFESGVRRGIEEKRKREEEEALRAEQRRIQEERRREAEERRRKDEARRREQADRRQKEADEFAALTGLRPPTRPLIASLSNDWDSKVANAARANPAAELVKTLEGQPLTRRDFEEKLLPPTAWLNDNIIIGSILHVADYINKTKGATDQEPKCAAFTSYFWPRLLSHGPSGCGRLLRRAGVRKANLLNIDTILIPICAQSHWTLAVIRPGKRTVTHIDSMRGGCGHGSVKTKLLDLVRFILEDQFVEADWRAVDYEAPRQTNGWDCGVFTITNAMCMALGLNPKFSYTERELTLQRRRLAAMLLNDGFKGEFSLDGF
ncbi:hypothetical protein C8A00DRAFT_13701 [Chaetomidium leptoderma]|uniref:Ubiquitin-like protease family profile domain-containing protein n=1 Tax=Chaetomidium leptoderma TaxID=669021 RepID=A0AAN6VRR7_9PEZI|nr:hypothetical protein C8A00DRAFT_13701 [Chaetomidium leptoderma]